MAKEWSAFQVQKQISYQTYDKPAQPPAREKAAAARIAEDEPHHEKCAVWIVHGMGQQVPYATLDELNQGICLGAEAEGITVSPPKFREVKVGETILQRVEITLSRGNEQKEVHLYESYWATKTEGVVSLKSVISFLWDGGSRGLVNSISHFHRALFGLIVPFRVTWRTPVYLLFTLAVLAALLTINAVILATGATWAGIGNLPAKIKPSSIPPLTTMAGVAAAAAITFGIVLILAQMMRPTRAGSKTTDASKKRWRFYAVLIQYLGWIALILTALTTIASAAVMGGVLWAKQIPAWMSGAFQTQAQLLVNLSVFASFTLLLVSLMRKRVHASAGESPRQGGGRQFLFILSFLVHLAVLAGIIALAAGAGRDSAAPDGASAAGWFCQSPGGFEDCVREHGCWACLTRFFGCLLSSSIWVWPFLAILSAAVRKLLVQYVGDVTVYVASYKLDKYEDVRKAIKALAKESASAVYSLKATEERDGEFVERDGFEYSRIAVVGHSLGSVIAYDTLNRLIADDGLTDSPRNVVGRTCLFLTFGSPLDKTAFFFSVMGRDTLHVREQLASVVQPLIEDPAVRNQIPWVNVYSRSDIISGPLDFYNFPAKRPSLPATDPQPVIPSVQPVFNVPDPDALVPLVAHVEYWQNSTVWKQLLERL